MFLTLLQSSGAGPGVITGTLAATESGADTAALSGVVLVQGTLAATEAGADGFAATGVVGSTEQPPAAGGGSFSNRPWRDAPFLPVRPRRPRKQRQEELVFLGY